MRFLERIDHAVARVEEVCLAIAMTVMLGSTVLVILSRYQRGLGLGYLSDLAVGLIPWVGMLGAAAGLYRGRHIGMVLIRDRLPDRLRHWLTLLAQLAIMAFLVLLIWAGWHLVSRQIASGVTTSAMEFPRWMISLALPVGAALALVHQATSLAAHLRNGAAGGTARSGVREKKG